MTKEEIIKSWIPSSLNIPEEDNKNDPDFLSVYTGSYAHDLDVFETEFVVNHTYSFNIKTGKLKESDLSVKFPFHAYAVVEDFVSLITDIAFGSMTDNCHRQTNGKKQRIILQAAKILDKKDLTLDTSYTDTIYTRISVPLEENGDAKPFEECEISFTLARIFSSIPEDFINIKCSEAYDKMAKIKKEMKDNLDESLVYKFVHDEKVETKERIEFVDCTLISLRDMYKNICIYSHYRKENK